MGQGCSRWFKKYIFCQSVDEESSQDEELIEPAERDRSIERRGHDEKETGRDVAANRDSASARRTAAREGASATRTAAKEGARATRTSSREGASAPRTAAREGVTPRESTITKRAPSVIASKEHLVSEARQELQDLDDLFNQYSTFAGTPENKELNLTNLDKWFAQAGLFDTGKIRKADTAVHFTKVVSPRRKMTKSEFAQMIQSLSEEKALSIPDIKAKLMAAGPPEVVGTAQPIKGTAAAENMERLTAPGRFTGTQKGESTAKVKEQQEANQQLQEQQREQAQKPKSQEQQPKQQQLAQQQQQPPQQQQQPPQQQQQPPQQQLHPPQQQQHPPQQQQQIQPPQVQILQPQEQQPQHMMEPHLGF